LAEREQLISRLFETKIINNQNCYEIWLNLDGEWQPVIIDDNFPCIKNQGPAFSQCHGPEIWVCLLEKAYAKLFGSYLSLEAGNPGILKILKFRPGVL
jgi:calpain-15